MSVQSKPSRTKSLLIIFCIFSFSFCGITYLDNKYCRTKNLQILCKDTHEPTFNNVTDPQVYTQGVEIPPLEFVNEGGHVKQCTSEPAMSEGLTFSTVDSSIRLVYNTCMLSGTPMEVSAAQDYRILASNDEGVDYSTVNIEIKPNPETPRNFRAVGGSTGIDLSWDAPLEFSAIQSYKVYREESSSAVVEIPVAASGAGPFAYTDTTRMFNVEYTYYVVGVRSDNTETLPSLKQRVQDHLDPPNLADLPSLSTMDSCTSSINLEFLNSGGGEITRCVASPNLPAGLDLTVKSDKSTCIIHGDPTAAVSAQNHTITATNPVGNNSGVINIEITSRLGWFRTQLTMPSLSSTALNNMTTINLSNRSPKLTSLPVCIFSGLTSLRTLYLSNNSLSSLDGGIFSSLTNLQTLSLDRNALGSLGAGHFSGLTNLQVLHLNNNSLSSLGAGVFSGLTLHTIWMYGNQLSSLPANIFARHTGLGELRLKNTTDTNTFTCDGTAYDSWFGSDLGVWNPARSLGNYPTQISTFICN